DLFLRRLYTTSRAADPAVADEQLDAWALPHEPNEPRWWVSKLERWGDELHARQGEAARFLWARLLDHLRVYQVRTASGSRNYTESAFQRFLRARPAAPAWVLEAKARLAAMRRLTGDPEPEVFRHVLEEIEGAQASDPSCKELTELRGWVLHQWA